MPDIRIYTTPVCGYCTRVKRLLAQKGVAYREIDVANDPTQRRWLVEATGRRTVPQVFIDGRPYGGYAELVALDQKGELDAILCVSSPS